MMVNDDDNDLDANEHHHYLPIAEIILTNILSSVETILAAETISEWTLSDFVSLLAAFDWKLVPVPLLQCLLSLLNPVTNRYALSSIHTQEGQSIEMIKRTIASPVRPYVLLCMILLISYL